MNVPTTAAECSREPRSGLAVGGLIWRPVPMVICAVIALFGVIVLYGFDPAQNAFYPVCVLYRTTGLSCPGCGSLRAVHQLMHGHLAAAFHFNAFLVCMLPLLGWLAVHLAALKMRNQAVTVRIRPIWLWSILIALVIFGIARNLPFAQHAGLAP